MTVSGFLLNLLYLWVQEPVLKAAIIKHTDLNSSAQLGLARRFKDSAEMSERGRRGQETGNRIKPLVGHVVPVGLDRATAICRGYTAGRKQAG